MVAIGVSAERSRRAISDPVTTTSSRAFGLSGLVLASLVVGWSGELAWANAPAGARPLMSAAATHPYQHQAQGRLRRDRMRALGASTSRSGCATICSPSVTARRYHT